MQMFRTAINTALVAALSASLHEEAMAAKVNSNREGPGRRTLYTYWSGTRGIYRGRNRYTPHQGQREKARRVGQMLREKARAEWRAHQDELDRQTQARWDEARAKREAANAA